MVVVEVLSSFVVGPRSGWIFAYKPRKIVCKIFDTFQISHFEGATQLRFEEKQVQNAIEYVLIWAVTFPH